MLYDDVLQDIIAKKENKEQGYYNGVPFRFNRYSNYFPGFDKGYYIGLLGATGSGKSTFTRSLVYDIVDFSINYNYPVAILYFALEDPKVPFYKKVVQHYMYTRQDIRLSQNYINSRDAPISDAYINAIKKEENFFREFDKRVRIVNEISSPNEIDKYVIETHKKLGDKVHLFVILDNQSNIVMDQQDESEWTAIKRMSRDIIRLKFCPKGITTIAVLQQDYDQERHTFRNSGGKSYAAIEPNLSSVGDAKVVTKSMHWVLALFSPWRYEIKEYCDYNCEILRNKIVSLLMLKSNESEMAPRLCMLFNGQFGTFEELPLPTDKERLDRLYQDIIEEEKAKKEKFSQTRLF